MVLIVLILPSSGDERERGFVGQSVGARISQHRGVIGSVAGRAQPDVRHG